MFLAIDTSGDVTVVGFCDADTGQVLWADASPSSERHGDVLLPRIRTGLQALGCKAAAVTALVVGVGPGSFTGLRVGIATAQGWVLASGVPAHGVVSAEAVALPYVMAGAGRVAVVQDAYRGEVALAVYGSGEGKRHDVPQSRRGPRSTALLRVLQAPVALKPEVAAERLRPWIQGSLVVVGSGLSKYAEALRAALPAECHWELGPDAGMPTPASLCALAQRRAPLDAAGIARELQPYYVRDADAQLPQQPLQV